ncbi:hypothetical protein [Pseudomonas sp. 6D_7.1_Bac1]|uniref:hypothetical protein n=1 Tax=Pseudomonas sp. 6D_7.1_Bac1 TaxID=2971615 RepID=UPI0021C98F0F|nr:hypothetical protein [Pseudomonas sp. 6D_7.1_Bac1]MCU1750591.1 hypothetical protein [Pseudomonas sp. 6D_7.1_Bac1]
MSAKASGVLPNIGSAVIDPGAESEGSAPAGLTGKQESDFFDQSGKHYEYMHTQLNLGWLGKFWGASAAPSNIAGLIAICTITMIFVTLCMGPSPEISDTRKLLFGLLGSALSFLFGAATKK